MDHFIQLDLRRGDSTVFFGDATFRDQFSRVIPLDEVRALCAGKRVCVFCHGYNVEEPMDTYARYVMALRDRYDLFIGVRWPGSQLRLAFWLACSRANKAGELAAKSLTSILASAVHVTLLGHSLGCRVLLQALKAGLHCHLAILAAAAVDDEALESDQEFGSAPDRARRILVAYSRNDRVLAKAYKLAKFDNALGRVGPQRPERVQGDLQRADLTKVIDGHSDYVRTEEFIKLCRLLAACD